MRWASIILCLVLACETPVDPQAGAPTRVGPFEPGAYSGAVDCVHDVSPSGDLWAYRGEGRVMVNERGMILWNGVEPYVGATQIVGEGDNFIRMVVRNVLVGASQTRIVEEVTMQVQGGGEPSGVVGQHTYTALPDGRIGFESSPYPRSGDIGCTGVYSAE